MTHLFIPMEDAELVLKELRIDWETVLTDDFNPLKHALEIKRNTLKLSNYRNIYHRVERVMERIIEETFKGFSDSVLSYTECYNLTSSGLEKIREMTSILDNIKELKINTTDIYKYFRDAEYLRMKSRVCEDLVELRNKHEKFKELYKEGNILKASVRLQEIRDLIKNKSLYKIKGIDTFGLEIENDVKDVCDKVFSNLDLFIYSDELEYKGHFRAIVALNRILKYDRYVYSSLERKIFCSIEEIIHKINREEGEVVENDVENEATTRVNKEPTTLSKAEGKATIFYTLKTHSKILCFSRGKPKVYMKQTLKNLLVTRIVNKINTVKYNLAFLRSLSYKAFENLDDKMKDYYAEYTGFMIFCEKGDENVSRIVQKIINTFIDIYTDNDKKDIDVEEFDNINILDTINYEEEFDEKYPIYSRITNNKSITEEKEDGLTLIFRPSIDICIDLYEKIREEGIKQRCMKYTNQREEDIFRRVIILFQDQKWDRNDYRTSTLWFTGSFMKIIEKVENILRVFGDGVLEKSLALIRRKMQEKFNTQFYSPIIKDCLRKGKHPKTIVIITDRTLLNPMEACNEKEIASNVQFPIDLTTLEGIEKTDLFEFKAFLKVEEKAAFKYFVPLPREVVSTLKDFVVTNSINNKELLNTKSKYDHILFSTNTLVDLSVTDLAYQFAFSFKIDLILEIFFYFDVYYREGVFTNTFYIVKIAKIIQQVYERIDLIEVFEILNFYVKTNRKRLNVKKREDLTDFYKGLELLDECLSDLSEEDSLKESIGFIEEEIKNWK